jgi:V8-like Glu-specific endopeptidase
MAIFPPDTRQASTNFASFPLGAVVAVDSIFQFPVNNIPANTVNNPISIVGTGIMVSPNHVLTAAHTVVNIQTSSPLSSTRVTTSNLVPTLTNRFGLAAVDPGPNVPLNNIYLPRNATAQSIRSNTQVQSDVALLTSTGTLVSAQNAVGIIAFVDVSASVGRAITTAGYPTDLFVRANTLVTAPGVGVETIQYTSPGLIYYDLDTFGGQSGSPIFHTLSGDTRPRTLGIHTRGPDLFPSGSISVQPVSNGTGGNSGVLITTDLYDRIVAKIAADSGTSNAALLPENAIIGVDVVRSGVSIDDTIIGSYRKERILGQRGNDKLLGGGADDRLEGGDGTDQALFADVKTNYKTTNTDVFNRFYTVEHVGGTKTDGKDSLQGIESVVFGFVDANKDKIDDDGVFEVVPLFVSLASIQPFSSTAEIGFSSTSRAVSADSQQASSGPKLKDGPEIITSQVILDNHEQEIGVFKATTSAWTVDGDVDYKLSILPVESNDTLVVDQQAIESIVIKVNDTVVDIIDPSQLIIDSMGNLNFRGAIADLATGQDVYNDVSFELIFTDCLDSITLEQQITGGQELNTTWSADKQTEINVLNVIEGEFVACDDGVNRDIYGNDFTNSITVSSGHNNLAGQNGNDFFILCGGENVVDGGADIDTARISMNYEDAGHIVRNGSFIQIGDHTTLSNTEFIEFNDIRLAASDLTVRPIVSLTESVVSVTEGADRTANVAVNLSSIVDRDVAIEYSTQPISALAGADFTENTGTLIIAAGESSGHIAIDIAENLIPEGFEQLLVNLKTVSGETFADNTNESTINIDISDNDSAIGVSLIADNSILGEGTQLISLERFGSLAAADTLKFQVVAAGSNPAQAKDFIDGFTEGQVSFAPGESIKEIEIPIAADTEQESDETFDLRLTSKSGSATIPSNDLIFTIRDYGQIVEPINSNLAVDAIQGDLLLGNQNVKVKDTPTEYLSANNQDAELNSASDVQTDIGLRNPDSDVFSSSAVQDFSLDSDSLALTQSFKENSNIPSILDAGYDTVLSSGNSLSY